MEKRNIIGTRNKDKGGKHVKCIFESEDKQLTFEITEEIDENTTEELRRKIDHEITRYMPRKAIFNFDSVSFMDSAGIGLILGRYKMMRRVGGEMYLSNVNKNVRKLLEMSGITKIIPITEKISME